jgi:hypothetical protein
LMHSSAKPYEYSVQICQSIWFSWKSAAYLLLFFDIITKKKISNFFSSSGTQCSHVILSIA